MKALVNGNTLLSYPYRPQPFFPTQDGADIVDVAPSAKPARISGKRIAEAAPVKINGVWTQQWGQVDLNEQETAQESETLARAAREKRNALLSECDWTQLVDAPVNAEEWATYRTALRDISEQAGFPWTIQWPAKPE